MWRNILLLILFCCFYGTTSTFAQKVDDDIIKIINGPTIYGGLDSIKRDTVFFRVNGKIPVTYPISQIEEFRKDKKHNNNYSNKENQGLKKQDSSLIYFTLSTGYTLFRAISPKITLGYRLHTAFIPILSVDYTWYNNAPGRFMGISGGITVSPQKDKVRPYYNLQFGYGINYTTESIWEQGKLLDKTGGLKMDIGVGIIKPIIGSKNSLTMGLNYGTQQATYEYNSSIWNWSLSRMENVVINEKIKYNRLYFTFGVIF